MSEMFVQDGKIYRRGLDGFWKVEGYVEVAKGEKKLRPIRGSRVSVVDDTFLLDIKKGSSDKEMIERRVKRLEDILPFEAEAIRRAARNEGVLEIGVFHGERKERVKVQQQPNVAHEVEQNVNKMIRQILRGEVGDFVSRKTDGGVRVKEVGTVKHVNKVLLDAYKKIQKNRR